ncbi:MAG: mechanosensitive ion channel, partial [Polyangiaceae bacterium]
MPSQRPRSNRRPRFDFRARVALRLAFLTALLCATAYAPGSFADLPPSPPPPEPAVQPTATSTGAPTAAPAATPTAAPTATPTATPTAAPTAAPSDHADSTGAPSGPPGEPDLSTPRRAMRVFIDEGRDGKYDVSARSLDLTGVPPAQRATEGPKLARMLKVVLDRHLWIVWEQISDEPEGNPEDGASTDKIGAVPLGDASIPIVLARLRSPDGQPTWRISRSTVAAIPDLYRAHGPGFLAEKLPDALRDIRFLELSLWQWVALPICLLLAWIGGVLLTRLALGAAARLARRTESTWDDLLLRKARSPLRVLTMLLLTAALVQPLHLAIPAQNTVDRILQTLFILCTAWLVTRLISVGGDVILDRLAKRKTDEAASRGDKTRVTMLRRVATVAVSMIAASLVLLQFEVVRQVGVSLLASAGIAGVVLGFAAQKSIATLLAGMQLSVSESVRIGDTVIVEGEWGTIEEVTLTYVVVKIWDL